MKPIYRKLMAIGMAVMLSASMATSAFAWHVEDGVLKLDDDELTATEFVAHSDAYSSVDEYSRFSSSTIKSVDLSDSANLTCIASLCFYNSSAETILIRNCNSLTSIYSLAFYMNEHLKLVDLSGCKALTEIEPQAFCMNKSLELVDLSGCKALTAINPETFSGDQSLKLVDLRGCDALTYIERDLFNGNTSDMEIYLPSNITDINAGAFDDYTGNATVYVENEEVRARYAAMLDLPNVHFVALPEESSFVSSITLNKNYNDLYAEAAEEGAEPAKTTAPVETLEFKINAIGENAASAPALPATVTMNVENGEGEAEIAMPTTGLTYGEYWYKLTETEGKTAGVQYNDSVYYLHLIVGSKGGELGVKYATIHKNAPYAQTGKWLQTDKIDTITNSYAEGKLTINQSVSGNGSDVDDEFTVTVTLTLPNGTVPTKDIVLSNGTTIAPDDERWVTNAARSVTDYVISIMSISIDVTLTGEGSVTISGLPDGTTYEVEQTETLKDEGYTAPVYELGGDADSDEEVVEATEYRAAHVIGTISNTADTINISSEKITPVDVGVILENGAYVTMALAAIAAGAFLVLSRKKKYEAE